MLIKSILIFFSLSFTLVDYARPAYEIRLNRSSEERLLQGEVIVSQISSRSNKGRTFEAAGIINASIDDVYQVLVNFDDYDTFMPHIHNTEVLKQNSENAVLNYTLGLPLGKIRKYRLYMTYSKNNDTAMVEWKMIEWPGIKKSETINDTTG